MVSLDDFDAVENHYREILNNNKGYEVFGVVRDKVQNQSNNTVRHVMFGSSGNDVINFGQGTMFARGGKGNDVYAIDNSIGNREVKIDNNSDDKKLDILLLPVVTKDFSIQQCDLYLNYNNTNIQVKNYLMDPNYRHLMVMNNNGETFIPYMKSISCIGSSIKNGKLVPFFHATQIQNMFFLSKDFQYDHVVIDSRSDDIKQYKDKGDLLLMRESKVPFTMKIEGYFDDQSRWKDVNFHLWNNGNFSNFDLPQEIGEVMSYRDKLKDDYEEVIKEYVIDFNQSVDIKHNQNGSLASIEQDKERIGVIVLKGITPDQVKVSSSGSDLVLHDTGSNHTINIKNWDSSESHRISVLEFDLGLDPIIIRRLDRFSLSKVVEIQTLIDKASENYQNKAKGTTKVENDLKCLVSVNGFKNGNKTYECLGFSSLQEQINFTESFCGPEQIEEFKNKIPNNNQVIPLLKKLQNGLVLNGYDQGTIDQCFKLTLTSELEILKLFISKTAQDGKWDEVKVLLDKTANRSNADVKDKNEWSESWTLLHYAVYNGNLNLVKGIFELLLDKVGNINARGKWGWTPLHYAAYYNEPDIFALLIDKGANIEIEDNYGKTPLEVANTYVKSEVSTFINKAIERDKFNAVMNFLKNNAKEFNVTNPSIKREISSLLKKKHNLFPQLTLLDFAAYNGRLDIVQGSFDLLLKASGGNINVQEKILGLTPLMYAVRLNRIEVVKFFLDKGASVDVQASLNTTALYFASSNRYWDIASLLFDHYSNVDWVLHDMISPTESTGDRCASYNERKCKLIHYAAQSGKLGLIDTLLNKEANIETKDKDDRTPLHYAVRNNKLDVVKHLLDKHANIKAKDKDGKTPLHFAAQEGCVVMIGLILDKKADINAKTYSHDLGWTPLHYAAYYNKPDAIKYLTSKGADVNAKDNKGNTPTYYAVGGHRKFDIRSKRSISVQEDRLDVLELLIDKANIEIKNNDNQTLFHVAAEEGNLRAVRLLVNKVVSIGSENNNYKTSEELPKEISQIEKLKTFISEKDKLGYTPLQYAAKEGKWGTVNLFLDKTAERGPDDVTNKDQLSKSWTTVHYAVYNGDLHLIKDIFQFLPDKDAVVNTKDSSDWTPLHYAVYYNALDIVKFLVSKGADIESRDRDGKTPLDISIDRKYDGVVQYLKQVQLNEQLLKAVQVGDRNEVKALISRKADVSAKDKDGKTPLHYASWLDSSDMVKDLIREGANIDAKDNNGKTPLENTGFNADVKRILMQAHLDKELLITVQGNDLEKIKSLVAQDVSKDSHGAYYYAWSGNLDTVKFLVEGDVNVNATDKYDCTLLHWAALKGHLEVAKFLVNKGANVNAEDIFGRSPMHFAAMNNHIGVLRYLVTNQANIDAKDNNGKTPLEVAREYFKLEAAGILSINKDIKEGKLDEVKHFLANNASRSDADAKDKDKWSKDWNLLHYAVYNGNLNLFKGVFELLLEKSGSINAGDQYGWTPLHYAVYYNEPDIVSFLVDKKADIDAQAKDHKTPLHVAAQYNSGSEITGLLLDKDANIKATVNNGFTVLHEAVYYNKLGIVEFLVSKGANIKAKNYSGETPLDLAIRLGESEIANFLRGKQNEKPVQRKRRHHHGDHPRHHSREQKYLQEEERFIYLEPKGASRSIENVNSAIESNQATSGAGKPSSWINDLFGWVKDSVGRLFVSEVALPGNSPKQREHTKLHYAAGEGELNLVKLRVNQGYDINAKNEDGMTPLDIANLYRKSEVVSFLQKKQKEYNSLLLTAARNGDLNQVQNLLDRGANIEVKGTKNETPLCIASSKDDLPILQLLVSRNANVNVQDSDGITPLRHAARFGQLDATRTLVEKGANISAKGKDGKTPLDIANELGKIEVANFLRAKLDSLLFAAVYNHHGDHPRHHSGEQKYLQRGERSIGPKGASRNIENINSAIEGNQQATSGASKPSSWIGSIVNWIKGSTESPALLTFGGHDSTTVTAVPEISADVVNDALTLGNFAIRLFNKTQYRQPTPDNLLSPLERLMRSDEGDIIREAILHSEHNKSKVKSAEEQHGCASRKILKKIQDIKEVLDEWMQCGSVEKSPLYDNLVEDIKTSLEQIKNNCSKEEMLKDLKKARMQLRGICDSIEDYWDNKSTLSLDTCEVADESLSIVIEMLKLFDDKDTLDMIRLQSKIREELKKAESQKARTTENVGSSKYVKGADTNNEKTKLRDQDISDEDNNFVPIDVPRDNNCLFWSVTMAYLRSVRDDDALFRQRYEALFGKGETVTQKLDHIRDLVRNGNMYNDTVAGRLVRNTFRNRVVDHILYRKEEFRAFVEGESGRSIDYYLQDMRNPNNWGGEPEIRAMSEMLSANISVSQESNTRRYPSPNGDIKIQLFHVDNNHYKFGLRPEEIINSSQICEHIAQGEQISEREVFALFPDILGGNINRHSSNQIQSEVYPFRRVV